MSTSPIFIVGCPRSGNGLMRNLLFSHPHLAISRETHFLVEFYEIYGDPQSEAEAFRLSQSILQLQWIRRWNLSLTAKDLSHYRSYTHIVTRLFEEFARQNNKPRWGDKTPQYVTGIPVLLKLFPSCKIIHMIRDGRDAALSWFNVNFGPRNVYCAAQQWKYYVSTGLAHGADLSAKNYFEVRYEDLLQQTEKTMRDVCTFIDEPYCEEILRPTIEVNDDRRISIWIPSKSHTYKPHIVENNVAKWKNQMSPAQKILFESVAGDLLHSLDYECDCVIRTISRIEKMFWRFHHLVLWVVAEVNRRNKLKWIYTDIFLKWVKLRKSLANRIHFL
ncbi:sulfotransferase [candidate division CSSED10-310 bacterium]|uniref:Sulfotransferase n=1 Tax=candidate division CSSED10-310 bacterium TaxID=2855610 RepID=A0ABV6YWM4_UNCC1